MIKIAVRVSELVSSNVDSMVSNASDPAKMLRHLCTEIEESLVSLHVDLAKATRRQERLRAETDKVVASSEEWTAKAKIAMDHKREDLARSALLAREDGRMKTESLKTETAVTREEIAAIEKTIAKLDERREEARARLQTMPGRSEARTSSNQARETKTERHLDRIDRIERRIGFVTDGIALPAPTSVDIEIAALQRDATIAAELAAMKIARTPQKSRSKKAQ